MSSLNVSLLTLGCTLAGIATGIALRRQLPDHHVRDDSKDVLKTATGMIGTLVALVIGLLVSSAKSSFDSTSAGVTQVSAKIVTIDRALVHYGPEAKGIRDQIRANAELTYSRLWPGDSDHHANLAALESGTGLEDVHEAIRLLVPKTDAQRHFQNQALQLSGELLNTRWLLLEQMEGSLPRPFLIVLLFWLTVLFLCFGLLAPWNLTAVLSLFVCAVSMSGAVFLILELNHPFDGVITVPSEPFRKTLELLRK